MTREPSITQWQIWQQLTSLCCIASVAEELGMLSDSLEDCVAFGCLCCNAQSWFVDDELLPLLPMPPSKLKFLNGSSYPFSLFPYFNYMVWTQRINHIACMSWQWLWTTQALPHGQVFYKPQKPYSMTTQLEIQGSLKSTPTHWRAFGLILLSLKSGLHYVCHQFSQQFQILNTCNVWFHIGLETTEYQNIVCSSCKSQTMQGDSTAHVAERMEIKQSKGLRLLMKVGNIP